MENIKKKLKGDQVIWAMVFFLSIISVLAVYASTGTLAIKNQGGNTEYYIIKHIIIIAFGFGLIYLTSRIRYELFYSLSQILLVLSVVLLILTLFIGQELNEAKRGIQVPLTNLTFQTSDLAKLVLIMYLARLLTKKQGVIKSFREAFIPIMIPVLIVCGLILPSNLSTAAMLFVTSTVLMFIGRVNLKYILSFVGIGAIALVVFIIILMKMPEENQGRLVTWKKRIESFKGNGSVDDNFQIEQSKIAIATGGFFGKTPGQSEQRNFLPHPYSDFIFAIIVEEYGLFGGFLTVLFYLILLYRAVTIVIRCPKNFGAFLAIGIAFSLVFQAMINMAVAVNIIPVTGQPLPLVSMGGTSIWFTSIGIGVILSVSKGVEKEKLVETKNAIDYAGA